MLRDPAGVLTLTAGPFLPQAAWNDHGPTASTFLEAFYALKAGVPVVATAAWQAAVRPNHLTHAQFLAGFPTLEAHAPDQNLDRRVPSAGALVVAYNLTARPGTSGSTVPDLSGNGYDAHVGAEGVLHTPLGSKGHNYTIALRAALSGVEGALLAGPDDVFGLVDGSAGGLTLAFTSSNITYPLSNFTLPRPSLQAKTLTEIVLMGTEEGTSTFVNGVHAGDFLVAIDGTTVMEPMAFVAPVQTLGGLGGQIEEIELWDGIQSERGA